MTGPDGVSGAAAAFSACSADGLAALGRAIGRGLREESVDRPSLLIALDGELGAGKTTLAAAALAALGVQSPVTSPTYGLVHPYTISLDIGKTVEVLHVDLYRMRHSGELDELGLQDGFQYRSGEACRVMLVEWFENARGNLGPPDLSLHLSHADSGRLVSLRANSGSGGRILRSVHKAAHPELEAMYEAN